MMVMPMAMVALMMIVLRVCWNYGPHQNDKSDDGKKYTTQLHDKNSLSTSHSFEWSVSKMQLSLSSCGLETSIPEIYEVFQA